MEDNISTAIDFDTNEVIEDTGGYSLLPDGDYRFIVDKSSVLDTKDKTGRYIKYTFIVAEGKYQGRLLWKNFNLKNKSAKAENIGRAQFKELCLACGLVGTVKDSSDLHDKLFVGQVFIKKSNDPQYSDQNDVRKFRPTDSVIDIPEAAAPSVGKTPVWMQ